jgi:hypothetical protein
LAFRLEQTIVKDGIVASRVAWETEPVSITANQALAAEAGGTEDRNARAEAEKFLRDLLAGGPVPAKEGEQDARALGIAPATLRRARKKLEIVADKISMEEGWTWCLPPPKALNNPEGAHHSLVSAFGPSERLRDTPEDHSGITTPRADDFKERAAIREYDGDETRQEAEAGAREDIKLLQRSKAELLSSSALSPPTMKGEPAPLRSRQALAGCTQPRGATSRPQAGRTGRVQ